MYILYIHIIYILFILYICNHESNVPSRLSPQILCGNNQEQTLFSWLHIYYAQLTSVRVEHSVCRKLHMLFISYIFILYVLLVITNPPMVPW